MYSFPNCPQGEVPTRLYIVPFGYVDHESVRYDVIVISYEMYYSSSRLDDGIHGSGKI